MVVVAGAVIVRGWFDGGSLCIFNLSLYAKNLFGFIILWCNSSVECTIGSVCGDIF